MSEKQKKIEKTEKIEIGYLYSMIKLHNEFRQEEYKIRANQDNTDMITTRETIMNTPD